MNTSGLSSFSGLSSDGQKERDMKASFIVNIPIKDRDGRIVGRKQVVKYEGLLARAHEDGLRSVHTELVQIPSKANGDVAIVRAVVVTGRGTFEGIGDASPANVNVRMVGALIRVGETRAKARALRDATNIGIVALEELDDVEDAGAAEQGYEISERVVAAPQKLASATAANGNAASAGESRADLMTQAQRRLLFRLAAERDVQPDDIGKWLESHCGLKDIRTWSKVDASRLIERLKANGQAGGAQ